MVDGMGLFVIRTLGLIPAMALLVLAGCFPTVAGRSEGTSPSGEPSGRCVVPDDADRMADQVLQLVNLERAEAGIAPVVHNSALEKIAGDYACRMVTSGFFGHTDPDTGRGPGDRAVVGKYVFYAIGENLAAGQQTPAEVMRVWMESPAHRDIILDEKWTEAGISVRHGGEYAVYWVQEFAAPAEY